jgi:predicted secreted protein
MMGGYVRLRRCGDVGWCAEAYSGESLLATAIGSRRFVRDFCRAFNKDQLSSWAVRAHGLLASEQPANSNTQRSSEANKLVRRDST